jgi:histidyl-tRNA synthetase
MDLITAVKGMRDFFPEDMALRQWLYAKIKHVSELFGYQEYDGPYVERLELYAAKSGEELVKEQSFVFPDRGGDMIALRPELTPSLARMVAMRSKAMPRPIRWWSFGPFWRYEQPQKGRTREFFQWNIDLLGVDSSQADAEIASVGAAFFEQVGLDPEDIRIKVNNRRLAEAQLRTLGIPAEDSLAVFRLIDRRERLDAKEWSVEGLEIGLEQEQLQGLSAILENADAWKESEELVDFFDAVEQIGMGAYIEYDPTIIRGLDYYTGTVFEARDAAGEHRAVFGGGRYDDLVADVGGEPLPGVGFAMGDVVLALVLEEAGKLPDLRPNPADVLLPTFDESLIPETLELATELRQAGLRVEWYPEPARLGRQFKYADRYAIPLAVILGPEEMQAGQISIKDLRTGEQVKIERSKAVVHLQSALEKRAGG